MRSLIEERLAIMGDRAWTAVEFAQACGITRQSASTWLHSRSVGSRQRVRIIRWHRAEGSGAPYPVFKAGWGRNADRLPSLSRNNIARRYRAKRRERDEAAAELARAEQRRADAAVMQQRELTRRRQRARSLSQPTRDWAVAALFGNPSGRI